MLYLGFRHGICLKIIEHIKHRAGLRKSKISMYKKFMQAVFFLLRSSSQNYPVGIFPIRRQSLTKIFCVINDMISQLRMHDKLFALFELLSRNEFAKLDDNVLKVPLLQTSFHSLVLKGVVLR